MEKTKNYFLNSKPPSGLESLDPLLENECKRQRTKDRFKKQEPSKEGTSRTSVGEDNVGAKRSASDKTLDLVINVELRKHESNFINAYYTDHDLKDRKAYHERVEKYNPFTNKPRFSTLNLLFDDEGKYQNDANDPGDYYTKDTCYRTVSQTNLSLERLLCSAENNLMLYKHLKLYDKRGNPYTVNGKRKVLPTSVHYDQFPMEIGKYDPFYDDPTKFGRREPYKDKHDCNTFNKGRMELENNVTFYKHKEVKMLNANKKTTPTDVVTSTPKTEKRNSSSRKHHHHHHHHHHHSTNFQGHVKENRVMDVVTVTVSDPSVDVKQKRLFAYEGSDPDVEIHESPVLIEIRTSSKFSVYDECKYSSFTKNKCSIMNVKSGGTYGSQLYTEDNYYLYGGEDERYSMNVSRKSIVTNIINRNEDLAKTEYPFEDIHYLKKKFFREQTDKWKRQQLINNSDLSNILTIDDNSLLKLGIKACLLKTSQESLYKPLYTCSDLTMKSNYAKQSQSLMDYWSAPSIYHEAEKTKKTLEVLFPVKSMRISNECYNMGDSVSMIEDKLSDISVQVQVTDDTVKRVEFVANTKPDTIRRRIEEEWRVKEGRYKEKSERERRGNVRRENEGKGKEGENDSDVKAVWENQIDMKSILNSREFRDEVLKIIDRYLEENYLKKDNFDVIVVPKRHTRQAVDPICALKEILNEHALRSIKEEATSVVEKRTVDLSTFNPRDFKGHASKYSKNVGDNTKLESPYLKKKSLPPNLNTTFFPEEEQRGDKDDSTEGIGLSKHRSMPAVKLRITKSSIHKSPGKSKRVSLNINNHKNLNDYNLNSFDLSEYKTNDKKNDNKSIEKSFNKLFTEFNEFRQIFDQVDVKHNSILNAIDYDPCGMLFNLKTSDLVVKR